MGKKERKEHPVTFNTENNELFQYIISAVNLNKNKKILVP